MMTERQIRETISHCVELMARYREGPRACHRREFMIAEVQAVVGWVVEMKLDPIETDEQILQPVGAALLSLYSYEVGPKLFAEFLSAFYDLRPDMRANGFASAS